MSKTAPQELFRRCPDNPLLTAQDIPYPANTVFNAGAAKIDDETLLLIRVEDRRGFSHLTVARSDDGITGWRVDSQPAFIPSPETNPEETWGIEDARITYIEELQKWAVVYTAYSDHGPLASVALTKDFKTFERLGPATSPENKDAALFPARFNGRYAMLHRPVTACSTASADVWISFSPDLKHWGGHRALLRARGGGWWEGGKIGLGPPPLQTSEGWLILYHGVRQSVSGSIYRLGLALLDTEDPTRVIRRSPEWVFGPSAPYERSGDVHNVVFPCGWLLEGDEIKLYYGGADTCIALAFASLKEILEYLRQFPKENM